MRKATQRNAAHPIVRLIVPADGVHGQAHVSSSCRRWLLHGKRQVSLALELLTWVCSAPENRFPVFSVAICGKVPEGNGVEGRRESGICRDFMLEDGKCDSSLVCSQRSARLRCSSELSCVVALPHMQAC
jgi:hypothetical protein